MLPIVENYAALVDAQLERILPRTLTGVTDAELDWRPDGVGNSIRWLLGHLLWYERWAPDAVEATGRFLQDRDPASLPVPDVNAWWGEMEAASARRRDVFGAVDPGELERDRREPPRWGVGISRERAEELVADLHDERDAWERAD